KTLKNVRSDGKALTLLPHTKQAADREAVHANLLSHITRASRDKPSRDCNRVHRQRDDTTNERVSYEIPTAAGPAGRRFECTRHEFVTNRRRNDKPCDMARYAHKQGSDRHASAVQRHINSGARSIAAERCESRLCLCYSSLGQRTRVPKY